MALFPAARTILFARLAVCLLAVVPFVATLSYELVWDDQQLLELITRVQQEQGIAGVLTTELRLGTGGVTPTGLYRPVVLLSLWFDRWLGNGLPAVFHLTNLALHALAAVLVLSFLGLFLSLRGAFVGAALFAVLPVHAESVAFASGRSDLWATVWILVTAILWIRDRQGRSTHPLRERAFGFVSFLLAGFSKETALVAPGVFLLWELFTPPVRPESAQERVSRNGAWVAVLALAITVVLFVRWRLGVDLSRIQIPPASLDTLLGLFRVWLTYFRLLIFPFPPNPWFTVAHAAPSIVAVVATLMFLGLCAVSWRKDRGRVGVASLVWFGCFLLPATLAQLGGILAERYLYLPSVGLAVAVGAACDALLGPGRRANGVLRGAALVLLVALSAGAASNSRIWESNLVLFRYAVERSPDSAAALKNLGVELVKIGRFDEAIAMHRRAVALDPADAQSRFNLGVAYEKVGDLRSAEAAYRQALGLRPDYTTAKTRLWVVERLLSTRGTRGTGN